MSDVIKGRGVAGHSHMEDFLESPERARFRVVQFGDDPESAASYYIDFDTGGAVKRFVEFEDEWMDQDGDPPHFPELLVACRRYFVQGIFNFTPRWMDSEWQFLNAIRGQKIARASCERQERESAARQERLEREAREKAASRKSRFLALKATGQIPGLSP